MVFPDWIFDRRPDLVARLLKDIPALAQLTSAITYTINEEGHVRLEVTHSGRTIYIDLFEQWQREWPACAPIVTVGPYAMTFDNPHNPSPPLVEIVLEVTRQADLLEPTDQLDSRELARVGDQYPPMFLYATNV